MYVDVDARRVAQTQFHAKGAKILAVQVGADATNSASGLNVLQGTVLQGDGPPRRLFEMSIALWKMPSKHSDFH